MNKKIVFALGSDLKNRILFARGGSLCFGRDLGDLSRAENYELFKGQVRRVVKRIKPDIIACDLHPGYFSTTFAKEYNLQPADYDLRLIQHHHAHIASVMQEHCLKGPLIGVAFDGTGYGEDANSWGGEFLLVNGCGFKRLAHLKYRMMPGGDKVVHEPWRMALSISGRSAVPFLRGVDKRDKSLILEMLAKNINSPMTSSAGRLFDAASALLGICAYASYEAQGPIKLEAMCDEKVKRGYGFEVTWEKGVSIVDTDGIFSGMLKDLNKGKNKRLIAAKFHNSMAEIIVVTVKKLSRDLDIKDIALSGGVFQNRILKAKAMKGLLGSRLNIFTNVTTPINDFNISLGQYYVSGCSRED
jgi:hydrogenase maturation protein HypF